MAVGRISGPLLKSNLIRNGIDLAFETDLLYLDVTSQRIGIKTTTPTHTEKPKTPSNQLSLFNEPKTDNKVEIEKLTKQIDYLEGEFDKLYNEDRNKNKIDLEELDVTIQSLVKKRDELEFGSSLPF